MYFYRNKSTSEGQTTALDASGSGTGGGSNVGGGFGKWLRDHLGGNSSRSHQEIVPTIPAKSYRGGSASYDLTYTGSDKNLTRMTHTPQNVYCSLPREQHRRHFHMGGVMKLSNDRGRCLGVSGGGNFRERSGSNDIGSIVRGGPIYGSEGKSRKKRERERRRHSMNETRVHSRQHRAR